MAILETRNIRTAIAGEAITAGQYCYICHPDAPYTYIDGATAGRAYTTTKSIRHRSINANLAGFALDTVSAGSSVRILEEGRLSGFVGLVSGQCYQPADTAGAIEILENNRAALSSPVAQAISTTDLIVFKQSWGVRGKGFWLQGTSVSQAVSFVTLTNSVTGALTTNRVAISSGESSIKSYWQGGEPITNTVDSLTFSTDSASCIDVGDLTVARSKSRGARSSTKTYCIGGESVSSTTTSNVIDAMAFSTEGNYADVGDLTEGKQDGAACVSATKFYVGMGYCYGPGTRKTLNFMAFATEGNATSLTDMPEAKQGGLGGGNSITNGYMVGGTAASATIARIIFATDASSTIAATLSVGRYLISGASYALGSIFSGGSASSTNQDQFIFATETNSLVGSFSVAMTGGAGAAAS